MLLLFSMLFLLGLVGTLEQDGTQYLNTANLTEQLLNNVPDQDKPAAPFETELNDTTIQESMDEEGEWVQHAPPEEIEEAKHLLDKAHADFTLTSKPLLLVSLVIIVTLLKPTLHYPGIRRIPESVVLMVYGCIGAVFFRNILRFDPGPLDSYLFFMILLPAIVNDAGLSMQKKEFFQALPKISLFAVFGTVIHAVMLAALLYFAEGLFEFTPGFLHLLVFSTLISAVDPVSVLSTFAELDVKRSLNLLVFGESLLNDAVTIVLYRTSIDVIKNTDATDAELTILGVVLTCTYHFIVVCSLGILCGVAVGLIGVFIMRKFVGHQITQPVFQLCVPYFCYLLAESGHYSGILASVSCSSIMVFYMSSNVCVEMEFATFMFSKTGSSLSESCIFCYLGISLVSFSYMVDMYFLVFVLFFCYVFRMAITFFLSAFYNLFVCQKSQIPLKDQVVVAHAGIRGAVCFGLVQIIDERIIPAKPYFVTATMLMILFTSVVQGCTIESLIKWLGIPGDDGIKEEDTVALKWLSRINNKYLAKFLSSNDTYLSTDETFRHLALPKAVSTALRIGERSHTDLTRHGEISVVPAPVSVGRPTVGPIIDLMNVEDDNRPLSTGRRTPVARNPTRYSRHFIYTAGETDNYLTCPVSGPKRPPFDPNQLYNNQNTISNPGDAARIRCINRRHNSMGAESIELKHLTKSLPLEKKLSRTVTSGNKRFVVNPDDFIHEESPSTSSQKKATFEDDEFSKIDESE